MEKIAQWVVAQKGEKALWDGVVHLDYYIPRVLSDNSAKAPKVRSCFSRTPESCLEVGIGPFGIGISGFLPEIRVRFGIDPLPLIPLEDHRDSIKSSGEIRSYMRQLRREIRYVVGCGEEIPILSNSTEFVICCNVIDHSSDPTAVLREIHRILKPDGVLFFDVDTFSLLGLAKWYSWTRYAHKTEILVTTHSYRMYEPDVIQKLRSCGFRVRKLDGHSAASKLIGHARDSTFVGI